MANILREILEEQNKNTTRRDDLRNNEKLQQQRWEEARVFECDADLDKEKFFATFPYPYMNGRLHVGHLFTISKADFVTYYHRMKGKNVIFPFSFHVTGMPIKACADKLSYELETFGPTGPPPRSEEEIRKEKEKIKEALLNELNESGNPDKASDKKKNQPAAKKAKTTKVAGEFHSNKSKVASKTVESKTQWDIMRSLGISDELVVKFTDAKFWLSYFPPLCKMDLKNMGMGIDWRRSFYTTDANPFYDRFVKWQFNLLKKGGKIRFGKRYSIYSPKDGQPCLDHDRQSGETVIPQEYTLIKMEVLEPFPEVLKPLEGQFKVFLAAATLRPETMYGQTNCWILPNGNYGAYVLEEGKNEAFILCERAARNLSYQDLSPIPGELKCVLNNIQGELLLGTALKAPYSKYEKIYTLPMLTISMNKGTGVVTSVPSDSPDDWAALRDLKNKPALREKFNIKDEWVLPFEPVPHVKTSLGDLSAVTVCDQFKIVSQNDREKLIEAKDLCYKIGFYEAEMLVGKYAGQKVTDCKDQIRKDLLDAREAVKYAEPEKQVISRSGDECIVALCDQWFLTYGEEEWKSKVVRALEKLDTFNEDTRHNFEHTIGWLNQWACSRSFGLGSRIPWDENYLIESLSDSTIYMAYYTIAHLIQGGVFDGSQKGPFNIEANQLTDEVFNYIFLNGEYPNNCEISEEKLSILKKEFNYWYPLDLRVSGKDLIPNHLTFFLYNHTAIWDQDENKWPRGIRGNGHLLLNNKKMSKQTGNFLTIFDSVELFGADATRVALAHAGDSFDDANYSSSNANKAILDLYNAYIWAEEIIKSSDLIDREIDSCLEDRSFNSQMNYFINEADKAYERMLFQKALIFSFYELRNARDFYRLRVGTNKMNRNLIMKFIEVQALLMVPITPHWSERVWTLLGKEGFIVRDARFPVPGPVDEVLKLQDETLVKLIDEWRRKVQTTKNRQEVKNGTIFVATNYPEWHSKVLEIVEEFYNSNNQTLDVGKITGKLKNDPIVKKQMKLAVPLLKEVAAKIDAGEGKEALNMKLPYDEKQFLLDNLDYITRTLEIPISIAEENGSNKVAAVPKVPTLYFNLN